MQMLAYVCHIDNVTRHQDTVFGNKKHVQSLQRELIGPLGGAKCANEVQISWTINFALSRSGVMHAAALLYLCSPLLLLKAASEIATCSEPMPMRLPEGYKLSAGLCRFGCRLRGAYTLPGYVCKCCYFSQLCCGVIWQTLLDLVDICCLRCSSQSSQPGIHIAPIGAGQWGQAISGDKGGYSAIVEVARLFGIDSLQAASFAH